MFRLGATYYNQEMKMKSPNYLEIFRGAYGEEAGNSVGLNQQSLNIEKGRCQSKREAQGYELNEINEGIPRGSGVVGARAGINSSNSFLSYRSALTALERRCPDHVDQDRWNMALDDGRKFLGKWGEQAASLGWNVQDLFGLHQPPGKPHPSYERLARYDCLGLVWLLLGRPVTMLSSQSAAIRTSSGTMVYRKGDDQHGPSAVYASSTSPSAA
jgi:hypothetical protein